MSEGEPVPVPDKGGWIDGETGEYAFGGPPPVEGIPVKVQPGVVKIQEPRPETIVEKPAPPKKAS